MMAQLLFLSLFSLLFPLTSAEFLAPAARTDVWRVGEVVTVRYNTDLTNYSIGLWQERKGGGSAKLGPILFQTTNGPESEVEWQVQIDEFDLSASDTFFLWLKQGPPSVQGVSGPPGFTSTYFTITDPSLSSSSSSSTTSVTTSVTTTSTTSSTTSSTSPRESPSTTAEGTNANQAPNETPPATSPSTSSNSGGLSVAAQAGIGVGVGIIGITCIFCAVLWFRYIRKQQRVLAELQQRAFQDQPPTAGEFKTYSMPPHPTAYWPAEMRSDRDPAELYHHRTPVEMGTGTTVVEIGSSPSRDEWGRVG